VRYERVSEEEEENVLVVFKNGWWGLPSLGYQLRSLLEHY
jgi:hypothetical protein